MSTHKNNLIIFTGPSGVGKGTIVKKVFRDLTDIQYSISCTTRPQRPNEIEGLNYFFKSRDEFESMIKSGELLEWAEFVGNYYGTPKAFVEKTLNAGQDVFLEIEVQGALQIMEKFPSALSLFLIPPSLEELEARLRKRGTESEEVLKKRLAKATEEMTYTDKFQHIVVNDDLDSAVNKIKTIILKARGLNKAGKL